MPTGHYDHTNRQVNMAGQIIGHSRINSLNRRVQHGDTFWNCTCLLCGTEYVRSRHNLLKHKEDANCGCLCKEKSRQTKKEHSMKLKPYGDKIEKIYTCMKKRCYSPFNRSYQHYGAKGITICDEWLNDKWAFYKWAIENGYKDGLQIDRIDNSKGYSPDNCRWLTHKEQQNNKTNNRYVDYQGKRYTVSELADYLNLPYEVLRKRLNSKTHKVPIDAPVKGITANEVQIDKDNPRVVVEIEEITDGI